MARAQIFMFDVIIAATAFFLMALLIVSISRQGAAEARQQTYVLCLSSLESLKANGTLSSVANESALESLLNTSLSQLPSRFGYELTITAYSLDGSQIASYYGLSGNLSDAMLRGDLISAESSFVTTNATPRLGRARLRCWVGK